MWSHLSLNYEVLQIDASCNSTITPEQEKSNQISLIISSLFQAFYSLKTIYSHNNLQSLQSTHRGIVPIDSFHKFLSILRLCAEQKFYTCKAMPWEAKCMCCIIYFLYFWSIITGCIAITQGLVKAVIKVEIFVSPANSTLVISSIKGTDTLYQSLF